MSSKYNRLPTADPEAGASAFQFDSIHAYDYPKILPCGATTNSHKFKSAFTYEKDIPRHNVESLLRRDTEPSMLCKCCSNVITVLCYIITVLTFPISAWFCFKSVQHYERLVVFRLGYLLAAKGPGLVFVLPCIDKWSKVDLRMKAFSIPPQKVVTDDGGAVEVGADVYFRVKDALMVVNGVQDMNTSNRVIAQTALQRQITMHSLSEVEADKLTICTALQEDINQMTLTWGVEIGRVEMSQIKVLQQPNTLLSGTHLNPVNALAQVLMPTGSPQLPLLPVGKGAEGGAAGEGLQAMAAQFVQCLQGGAGAGAASAAPMPAEATAMDEVTLASETERLLKYRTAHDLLTALQIHLGPDLVRDCGCMYKFTVTGDNGGVFFLDLKTGNGSVGEGCPPSAPDVSLTLTTEVLERLMSGQLTAFNAYVGGKLEVDGDLKAATKLSKIAALVRKDG